MKHLTTLLLTFLFYMPTLSAQQVISSGGTHATGTNFTLSWTIGEPVTETIKNGSSILTQGFHQSRLSASAIDDIPMPDLSLKVFPNPFNDILNLNVTKGDFSMLQYSLFTMEGKMLLNNKIIKDLTQIDMQTYAQGNYLLKVSRKTGELLKTFKVVKQ